MSTPPSAKVQWLDAELDRIWLVAERCLRDLQAAGLRPPAGHSSLSEIEGILRARRLARAAPGDGDGSADELEQALARSEAALIARRPATPLGDLAESLGLRPLELEILAVAMAPHIDAPLADLFSLLHGSPARRGVDLALVAQIYRMDRSERVALLDAMDPERPLLSWRLVQIMPPESAEAYGSVNYRAIQPTFDLLSVLCGRGELSPAMQRCARLMTLPPSLDDLLIPTPLWQRLQQLCAEVGEARKQGELTRMPWVVLWGPRGAGKREIAARVAACAGRPLLAFKPQQGDAAHLDELTRQAQRESLIRGAVLYVGPLTADALGGHGGELARRMEGYPMLAIFGIETMQPPRVHLNHALQEIQVTLPDEALRLELWERAVPEELRDPQIQLDLLAQGFHLTPGEILETAGEATAVARLRQGGVILQEDLRGGIERRLRNELGEVARRLTLTTRWDDLVLPAADLDRVWEFISRSQFGHRVFHEWGFGDRIGYGKGMIALFSGPPGTGKTLLAGLIAQALGLDIYQVDLSQVISKWVGETEKQLGRVFDQAERAHAVLLFDEADALMSRRTEVKTSNDRYGNLAVNYLLQRLEQYSGVVVLTTNKEAALDEALQRRLSLHLHLQVPEPGERERLWRSMLPSRVPCARNIDFEILAQEYELTGGYIKNVTLRAAFLAASEGGIIHMGLLRRAAALELEDMGRLVSHAGRGESASGAAMAEEPEGALPGDSNNDFVEG